MFGIVNYELFFMSCMILSMIPGSDTIYILTQSIANDRKTGIFFSTLGDMLWNISAYYISNFRVISNIKSSPTAFQLVKIVGAAYLIYLGIKSIRSKESLVLKDGENGKTNLRKAYVKGLITNVLNPKVALFFIAFLPSFVNTNSNYFGVFAFVLLGLTYFFTTTVWSLFLSFIASYASIFLRKKPSFSKGINIVAGLIFIVLGAHLLVMKSDVETKEIEKVESTVVDMESKEIAKLDINNF